MNGRALLSHLAAPSHLATQPLGHPATRPPSHPATRPPGHSATQPLVATRPLGHPATRSHPATRPPSHPATQPPSHPAIQPSSHLPGQPGHPALMEVCVCFAISVARAKPVLQRRRCRRPCLMMTLARQRLFRWAKAPLFGGRRQRPLQTITMCPSDFYSKWKRVDPQAQRSDPRTAPRNAPGKAPKNDAWIWRRWRRRDPRWRKRVDPRNAPRNDWTWTRIVHPKNAPRIGHPTNAPRKD